MIVFVYHEAHEDHEEFTIKLYRPPRFKPRGRYNLITNYSSENDGGCGGSGPSGKGSHPPPPLYKIGGSGGLGKVVQAFPEEENLWG